MTIGEEHFRYPPKWIGDYRPPREPRTQLRRLGEILREVATLAVDTNASGEELESLIARATALRDALHAAPTGRSKAGYAMVDASGSERAFLDASPVIGLANAVAPSVRLRVDGHGIAGEVLFDPRFEGPPGCVHGGILAADFDGVLGVVQTATARPGTTATMWLRYGRPVPLHAEVQFRGWLSRVERRNIVVEATLHVGDWLCTEVLAVFVSVDFRRMQSEATGRRQEHWPGLARNSSLLLLAESCLSCLACPSAC
jgi:acyl-coenzyme A thioesterase PaaI-like protein